jgi:hypothetical protein
MPSALAIQKRLGHYARYSGVLEPDRSGRGFVHLAFQGHESLAGGCRRAGRQPWHPSRWEGIGQPPGNKQEACLGEVGVQVGKPSAVEHNGVGRRKRLPHNMVPGSVEIRRKM